MDDLREIVDAQAIGRLFALLALLVPLLAVAIGSALGKRKGDPKQGAVSGLIVGLLAPLNWALWRLYNAIVDSTGIDTVRNVVINLVLFVVIGFGTGAGLGNWKRKNDAKT
ncbi:MAG: hypothetical protein NT023_15115 [Armatimonadetes bacterium]|nr:hypothetical protein [Armatimonadota bacterium]